VAKQWIAVLGPIDPRRTEFGLRNLDQAQQVLQEMRRALAEKDCGVVVYSSDPTFVEPHIVKGPTDQSVLSIHDAWRSGNFSNSRRKQGASNSTLMRTRAGKFRSIGRCTTLMASSYRAVVNPHLLRASSLRLRAHQSLRSSLKAPLAISACGWYIRKSSLFCNALRRPFSKVRRSVT
jgi:hypothetical protein